MDKTLEAQSAVEAYHDLDVSLKGELVKELFEKVDEEAGSSDIVLSGDADPGSPAEGLTPRMQNWHANNITYLRNRSIAEAQAVASKITLGESTPGVIEQVEIDKAKRHRTQRRAEELNTFRTNNAPLLNDLGQLKREFDHLRIQENNRDPKLPPSHLVEGLLIHAIMIPEALINFPIIAASSYVPSGIAALGLTYIIGVLFGLAGLLGGQYMQGFKFYMTPDNPDRHHKGWVLVAQSAFCLTLGMGVVTSFRYFNVLETIALAMQLGTAVPNAIVSTLSVSLGNLAIYAIGMVIATRLYDENPDYAKKAAKLATKRKNLARKNKALHKILDEVDAKYRQEYDGIKNISLQMKNNSKYAELQSLLTTIESKDNKIVGIYGSYKEKLSKKITQSDADFTFKTEYSAINGVVEEEKITIPSFLKRTIVLYWT